MNIYEYKQDYLKFARKQAFTGICFGFFGVIGLFGFINTIGTDSGIVFTSLMTYMMLPVLMLGLVLSFVALVSLVQAIRALLKRQDTEITYNGETLTWLGSAGESFKYTNADIDEIQKRIRLKDSGTKIKYYLVAKGNHHRLLIENSDEPIDDLINCMTEAGVSLVEKVRDEKDKK